MYPGMAKMARDEGFDEIADWFETLAKAERSHANRFQQALDTLADRSSNAACGRPRPRSTPRLSSRHEVRRRSDACPTSRRPTMPA